MKHRYLYIFFLIGFLHLIHGSPAAESLSDAEDQFQDQSQNAPDISAEHVPIPENAFFPGFIIAEDRLYPGSLFEAFMSYHEEEPVLYIMDGEKILYAIPPVPVDDTENFEPFLYFLQGLDSTVSPGNYQLRMKTQESDRILHEYYIEIYPRDFHSEEIVLNTKLTEIRTDASSRRINEGRELIELLETVKNSSRFMLGSSERRHPLQNIVYTSFFGDRRVYVYDNGNTATSVHNGLDYRGAVGETIFSPFNGRVRMAKDRIVTGNTVILEHLPGTYSLYYHLSSMDVAPGDDVIIGDVLGTIGATGLATGPHLHWEIRVRGVAVDPEIFLEGVLLDRGRLSDILSR